MVSAPRHGAEAAKGQPMPEPISPRAMLPFSSRALTKKAHRSSAARACATLLWPAEGCLCGRQRDHPEQPLYTVPPCLAILAHPIPSQRSAVRFRPPSLPRPRHPADRRSRPRMLSCRSLRLHLHLSSSQHRARSSLLVLGACGRRRRSSLSHGRSIDRHRLTHVCPC